MFYTFLYHGYILIKLKQQFLFRYQQFPKKDRQPNRRTGEFLYTTNAVELGNKKLSPYYFIIRRVLERLLFRYL